MVQRFLVDPGRLSPLVPFQGSETLWDLLGRWMGCFPPRHLRIYDANLIDVDSDERKTQTEKVMTVV